MFVNVITPTQKKTHFRINKITHNFFKQITKQKINKISNLLAIRYKVHATSYLHNILLKYASSIHVIPTHQPI
jgi:hypothetical protein